MSITQISCTNFVKDPILRSATIIQTNSHNWEYDFLILRCFSFRVGSGEATDSIILLFLFFFLLLIPMMNVMSVLRGQVDC